jgi:hypothetical protein
MTGPGGVLVQEFVEIGLEFYGDPLGLERADRESQAMALAWWQIRARRGGKHGA